MTLSRMIMGARWCHMNFSDLRSAFQRGNTLRIGETRCTLLNSTLRRRYQTDTKLMIDQKYAIDKDTVLFKNENTRFFKIINIFAMSQFFFWSYLSHFALTVMKDVEVKPEVRDDPNVPWWKKINFGKFKNGLTISCFLVGWGTMAISWMYTLHSVRYLILKKGGKALTFVTFAPFGKHRILTVPIEMVSAKQSRMTATVHLPLKVKGKYLHYILDMRGQFMNAKLFDYSAGLKRNWSN